MRSPSGISEHLYMTPVAQLTRSARPNTNGSTRHDARLRHRPGHAPRPRVADVCGALAGIGFGATLGAVITGETRGSLAAPGGLLIAGGRLTGFSGAYLMLLMVLLIARLPWLERAVGQDRLVRWHRRIGPWALILITAHVVLITLGYAQLSKTGALRQLWIFLSSYPDMLAAIVGFGLLVMVAITSIRIARRHLKYETWWVVHLYTYLALSLAFAHQIVTGGSFIGHPLARDLDRGLGLDGRPRPRLPLPSSARSQPSPSAAHRERPRRRPVCTRSSAPDADWTAWRYLEVSSSSGASSLESCGGRPIPTHFRRCHGRRTSA